MISDEDVIARFPGEWIDLDNVAFFRGMLQRQLLIRRCDDCGNWFQPPWPSCPRCWSTSVPFTEVGGRGVVHTFTAPPTAASNEPQCLAVVTLAEQDDLRATGVVVDCPLDAAEVGMPVTLTWVDRDGHPVPAFRRA